MPWWRGRAARWWRWAYPLSASWYISDVALVQVTAAGTLDSSFSGDGIQLTNFAGSPDRGYAAALQPDGRLVVAGLYFGDRIDFGLARFNPDGSLDTSFDGDGLVSVYIGASHARDVAIQADGKIVAVGRTFSGRLYRGALQCRWQPGHHLRRRRHSGDGYRRRR